MKKLIILLLAFSTAVLADFCYNSTDFKMLTGHSNPGYFGHKCLDQNYEIEIRASRNIDTLSTAYRDASRGWGDSKQSHFKIIYIRIPGKADRAKRIVILYDDNGNIVRRMESITLASSIKTVYNAFKEDYNWDLGNW